MGDTTQAVTDQTVTTDDLILVIGGTGRTGRRVAERLSSRGYPVRIGSRSADPAFDWENPDSWIPTLAGVKAAYVTFYPDLGFPGADTVIEQFTKVAHEQGVARLVLLSGRGEEEAQVCERIVQRGGTQWTILRSAWFSQNFSENFLLEPVLGGEIVLPAGDAVEAFVDLDDLADVAVAALTDDKHVGQVYELSGPRLISFHDAAAELTKAIGREVRYVPVSTDEYRAMLREYGLPEDFVELFTKVLDGRNAHTVDGVQRALGRAPKDFAVYARETAATGVWNAG